MTSYDAALAREIGLEQAIIMDRLSFLEPRARTVIDGAHWVYKSLHDWADETGLSVSAVRRALTDLLDKGWILKGKFRAKEWKQVCYYRLSDRLEVLKNSICCFEQIELPESANRDAEISKSSCQNQQLYMNNTTISPTIINDSHSLERGPEKSTERERENFDFEIQKPEPEKPPVESSQESTLNTQVEQQAENIPPASEAADNTQPGDYSAKKRDKGKIDAFLEWLHRLGRQVGVRCPEAWAEVVSRNPNPLIVRRFETEQQQRAEVERILAERSVREEFPPSNSPPILSNSPPIPMPNFETYGFPASPGAPPPPPGLSTPVDIDENRLQSLKIRWNWPQEGRRQRLREQIREDVQNHPEWGITIGEHGPELMEF